MVFFQNVPTFVEIPEPLHKGLIIVGAKTMPVFQDEISLHSGANLPGRRQLGIREDVALYPRIGHDSRCVSTDCMQQEKSMILQAILDNAHESGIVFVANVFEHSYRDDVIE